MGTSDSNTITDQVSALVGGLVAVALPMIMQAVRAKAEGLDEEHREIMARYESALDLLTDAPDALRATLVEDDRAIDSEMARVPIKPPREDGK